MKSIAHIDLDCFYVSAERLRDPSLVGVPVAVGGTENRGVISSCSYEARAFGVRSAMPTREAQRRCPGLKLLYPDFSWYEKHSKQVMAILHEFSPRVEVVSIDEAYVDLTGTESLWGPAPEAAEKIRIEVRKRVNLPVSVGLATSRTVAKIATDLAKPDGMKVVEAGREREFLAPLDVARIPGVGKKTAETLKAYRYFRIKDLQETSVALLEPLVGSWAEELIEIARGNGNTQFFRAPKQASISKEETFSKDLYTFDEAVAALSSLVDSLSESLFRDGIWLKNLTVKIRDQRFQTITRTETFGSPSRTYSMLRERTIALFEKGWDREKPIRLLGVGGEWVDSRHASQLDLFQEGAAQDEDRAQALIEEVQKRFGRDALRFGRD